MTWDLFTTHTGLGCKDSPNLVAEAQDDAMCKTVHPVTLHVRYVRTFIGMGT